MIPVDPDATIVLAHPEKEHAAPTWKRTFGFHPMTAFIDHGPGGAVEAAALVPRPGNAGSNTADDHITTARAALQQIPSHLHRRVLIRTDAGGGRHGFVDWAARRRLKYSIGFNLTDDVCAAILALPERVWECACDAEVSKSLLHLRWSNGGCAQAVGQRGGDVDRTVGLVTRCLQLCLAGEAAPSGHV